MAFLCGSLATLRLTKSVAGSNKLLARCVSVIPTVTPSTTTTTSRVMLLTSPSTRYASTDVDGEKKVTSKTTKIDVMAHLKNYFQSTKDIGSSPAAPLALGLSGLLPFMYPPIAMISSGIFSADLVFMHLAYGATILSFIGGLRWGYCLSPSSKTPPSWLYLGYSVAPQLAGWAALLMPTWLGILSVIVGLVACAFADAVMPGYPAWFVSMRVILTTGAVFSLLLSLWCLMMLK